MTAEPAVRVLRDGPVMTVLLHRPERRNAVDGPTAAALAAARGVPLGSVVVEV